MPPPVAEYNNFHMNTEVCARVSGSNAAVAIADVSYELVQLENVLSCYLPESEISRINQCAGIAQVPVSPGTFEMLSFAAQLSLISGGLFDITVNKGKRWHHIIHPESGYPAESGLISVTVIAHDAMTADGLSTTLFVAGLEKGLCYLAEFPGTEAVFADDDCHIFITRGLKDCFRSADGIAYSIL